MNNLDASLFENLTKLTKLILKGNSLESLDKDTFKSLKQLEYINLECNELSSVDGLFDGLLCLKEINFNGNYEIKSIDMNQFIKLHNLSKLSLPNTIVNDEIYLKDIKYLIKNNKVDINKLFSGSDLVSRNYIFK